MAPLIAAMEGGGPWFVLLLAVGGFLFLLARGFLVTSAHVERIERRIEKDTDRVLDLYKIQISDLKEAVAKKDQVIEKQAGQIEKLMSHSAVSAHALDRIVEEGHRRGMVP